MLGKKGFHIRIQQEKAIRMMNFSSWDLKKVLKMQTSVINVQLNFHLVLPGIRQVMVNKKKWDQIDTLKTACVPIKENFKRLIVGWNMV